jgi:hypothetical protein
VTERALGRPGRPAAARLLSALEAPLAVPLIAAALIVAGFVSWALLDRQVQAPWVMEDELRYALVSRSFLSTGHYLFREHADQIRSVYPALISPAWLAGSTRTSYSIIKTINSGLMVAGAIPLFFWARRLVAPGWALLAIVLYLAMPGLVYSGEILTENAFVPAILLALFAIAVAIERPTLLRQLLALGAIVLALAARLQGGVLLIVLPVAVVLAVLFDVVAAAPTERRRVAVGRLRRYWPSIGGIVLAVLLYVVYETARGVSLGSGTGGYQDVIGAHYQFVPVVRWSVYQVGELVFAVGIVPLAALIVLFGLACRRATAPSPAERAFLAVTTAAVVLTTVQIGAFSSHYSLRVEERYMFNVFPVLFLAFVVWLGRGLPRPPALTAVALVIPIVFLLALPFESLISTGAFFTDTFGLIPFWRLTTVISGGVADARILLGGGALLAALLFACLPRSWGRVVLPVALVGYLMLASASVFAQTTYISRSTRHAGGLAGDPAWIDHTIGKHQRVEFLYTTDIDVDQHILWQSEFWNRSVRRVFGVTSQDPSIPDVSAPLDPATGRIVPQLPAGSPDAQPRYVVAASNLDVDGTRIASAGLLSLYRVRAPLRLSTLTTGLTADRWTGASATYNDFLPASPGEHLVVTISRPPLSGPPPAHVAVAVGRLGGAQGAATISKVWSRGSWTLRNGTSHRFDLPLQRGPFQLQIATSPTFAPSQYGLSDTRTLGVQVSLALRR